MPARSIAADDSTACTGSIAEATRAVVQEFLAARLAGDTGRLVELFADEVDWQLAENPAVSWIRARAAIDAFLVDGTDAVLMGRLSGTVRATERSFEGPFALHLTVEDGRITRHRLYENSLSIARACTR